MSKFLRRNLWFISGFLKKYQHIILIGLIASILLALGYTQVKKILPDKQSSVIIGTVGQYTAQELPSPITQLLQSGLTRVGLEQEIIPNKALEWSIDDSQKTYTFKLQPDLLWSDGTPIQAQDINMHIPNIETQSLDDQTISFTLPAKFAPFPALLTFPIINDKGLLPDPYQIKLKQKNTGILTQLILTAHDQQIIIKFYPSSSQALTAYKMGQIDALITSSTNTDTDLSSYGLFQLQQDYSQIAILLINSGSPVLQDKTIRQGIAYTLADKSFGFTRAFSTINPQSWAYNPLVKSYDKNPNRGSELIKNSLPENTNILNLELATTPELLPIAEEIVRSNQNPYLEFNIKVSPQAPEDYQLFLTTFNVPIDPDQYAYWHSTQNTYTSNLSSEKLDKLLEDGRTTLDKNERKQIYTEFQRVFAEELPAIPLFHPHQIILVRNQRYFDIINTIWPLEN